MARAKFRVTAITKTVGSRKARNEDGTYKKNDGYCVYDKCELNTVVLAPVYGNDDPNHENSKFWDATPTGGISLGFINPDAAKEFELDKEYYVDITQAN